jgi:crotonobetainyl-CoA:carnitine CoA-transferase CaiB-like acyl-CoA transferase
MTHPLRSLLFCPATASRRVRKLPTIGADAVAIDLEDAVATERKVEDEALVTVDDDELGRVRMHDVVPRLSCTPGTVRHAGRPIGSDNERVFVEMLGHDRADLDRWRRLGVI